MRYNARAYLFSIRNIDRGLQARHTILSAMTDGEWRTTHSIAKATGLSMGAIRYHLKNMERDSSVEWSPESQRWRILKMPQAELSHFIKVTSRKRSKRS